MKHWMAKRLWVAALVVCSSCAIAQDKGFWRATSNNAKAITGDVGLADEKISMNLIPFTIAPIRVLKPEEAVAAFDADSGVPGGGELYRINIAGATKFQHKNTLCGGEDTQWMATYATSHDLRIAFFSGAKPPVLTIDALGTSSDLCGTFTYSR